MYARYKPSKDTIHYQLWRPNGGLYADWTNSNNYWGAFYYPRRHKNIPSDENIYHLFRYWYGESAGGALWALTDQGHIYGAGYDKDGILGVPTNKIDNSSYSVVTYFTKIPNVDNVVKLMPNWYKYFIKADGTLWEQSSTYSTVENEDGTSGNAYTWSQDTSISDVFEIKGNSGSTAFYALKTDGTVWVKGTVASATTDSLGLGSETTTVESWTQLTALSNIVQIHTTNYTYANSENENFAINSSGKVYAWGYNNAGQLATSSTDTLVTAPTLCTAVYDLNVKGIASLAGQCTLFLTYDGHVYHIGNYSTGSSTVNNRREAYQLPDIENIKDIYFENRTFYAWLIRYDGFYYMVKPYSKTLTNLSNITLVTSYNFLADKLTDVTGTYTSSNGIVYYYKQTFTYRVGNGKDNVIIDCNLVYGTSDSYGSDFSTVSNTFTESTYTNSNIIMTAFANSQLQSWEQAIDPVAAFDPTSVTDPGTVVSGSWPTNSGKSLFYAVTATVTGRTSTTATITYVTKYGLTESYGTTYSTKTLNVDENNRNATTELNALKSTGTYNLLNIIPASTDSQSYTASPSGIIYQYQTTFTQGEVTLTSNKITVTTVYGTTTSYGTTYSTTTLTFTTTNYANAASDQSSTKTSQVNGLKAKLNTLIGEISLPSPNPKTWEISTNSGKKIYLQTTYTKS